MNKVLLLLACCVSYFNTQAQFNSRQYYKHNHIDGWIKITESNWFTISQSGDTTFISTTLEETNQSDPNIKPKYEFDGMGNIIKPDTAKKIIEKPIVRFVSNPTKETVASSESVTIESWDSLYDYKPATKIKYLAGKVWYKNKKGKTAYRNIYKYKTKKPIPVKKKKEKVYETIKFIDYKKKLWIAGSMIKCTKMDFYTQFVIEAETKEKAKKLFINQAKRLTKPENGQYVGILSKSFGIYEFNQFDIVK